MQVKFKFEKATKNTFRFFEVNEGGEKAEWDEQLVGTLYVKKAAFARSDFQQPNEIVVEIKEVS